VECVLKKDEAKTPLTKKNRHAKRTGLLFNLPSQAALAQAKQELSISPRGELGD
jgi:hypothetical protein